MTQHCRQETCKDSIGTGNYILQLPPVTATALFALLQLIPNSVTFPSPLMLYSNPPPSFQCLLLLCLSHPPTVVIFPLPQSWDFFAGVDWLLKLPAREVPVGRLPGSLPPIGVTQSKIRGSLSPTPEYSCCCFKVIQRPFKSLLSALAMNCLKSSWTSMTVDLSWTQVPGLRFMVQFVPIPATWHGNRCVWPRLACSTGMAKDRPPEKGSTWPGLDHWAHQEICLAQAHLPSMMKDKLSPALPHLMRDVLSFTHPALQMMCLAKPCSVGLAGHSFFFSFGGRCWSRMEEQSQGNLRAIFSSSLPLIPPSPTCRNISLTVSIMNFLKNCTRNQIHNIKCHVEPKLILLTE